MGVKHQVYLLTVVWWLLFSSISLNFGDCCSLVYAELRWLLFIDICALSDLILVSVECCFNVQLACPERMETVAVRSAAVGVRARLPGTRSLTVTQWPATARVVLDGIPLTPCVKHVSVTCGCVECTREIQTHKMFKRTLFIRTKYNMRIVGVIPFIELQNDT